jgi:hypothetical protein
MRMAPVGEPVVQHFEAAGSQLVPPYEASKVRSKQVMMPPDGVATVLAERGGKVGGAGAGRGRALRLQQLWPRVAGCVAVRSAGVYGRW